MRRAEIQKKGDFGRGEVPFLDRYAQVARTREYPWTSAEGAVQRVVALLAIALVRICVRRLACATFLLNSNVPQKSRQSRGPKHDSSWHSRDDSRPALGILGGEWYVQWNVRLSPNRTGRVRE